MFEKVIHFCDFKDSGDLSLSEIAASFNLIGSTEEDLFYAATDGYLKAAVGVEDTSLLFSTRIVGGVRHWSILPTSTTDARSYGITLITDAANALYFWLFQDRPNQPLETDEQKVKFQTNERHLILDSVQARLSPACGISTSLLYGLELLVAISQRAEEVTVVEDPDTAHPGGRTYFFYIAACEFDQSSTVVALNFPGRLMEILRDNNMDIAKATLPGKHPEWKRVEDNEGRTVEGPIKLTITGAKKNSALFPKNSKPHVFDEITGTDRLEMEAYAQDVLRWHEHYNLYYNIEGWTYEVKWKEKK